MENVAHRHQAHSFNFLLSSNSARITYCKTVPGREERLALGYKIYIYIMYVYVRRPNYNIHCMWLPHKNAIHSCIHRHHRNLMAMIHGIFTIYTSICVDDRPKGWRQRTKKKEKLTAVHGGLGLALWVKRNCHRTEMHFIANKSQAHAHIYNNYTCTHRGACMCVHQYRKKSKLKRHV